MVLVSVSRGDMVVRACVLEVANERVSAFIIQFLLSVKLRSLTFAWYQLKLTFPIYCLYCPTSSSYIYLFWSINTIVIINQCSDQDSLVESSKFHIAAYDSSVFSINVLRSAWITSKQCLAASSPSAAKNSVSVMYVWSVKISCFNATTLSSQGMGVSCREKCQWRMSLLDYFTIVSRDNFDSFYAASL